MRGTRASSPEPSVATGETAPGFYPSRGIFALISGVLLAMALLAYLNSFLGETVFDNEWLIAKDPRIQRTEGLSLIFTTDYWYSLGISSGLYRPLTTLTYFFNYTVLGNGPSPFGYHLINFSLHFANSLLVFLLANSLWHRLWLAYGSAILFLTHPVNTEAVSNIAGRADLLATLFILTGLLCHVHRGDAPGSRQKTLFASSLLSFALALLSKETGVLFLPFVLLADFLLEKRQDTRNPARVLFDLSCLFILLLWLVTRYFVLTPYGPMLIDKIDNPLVTVSLWERELTAVKVLGKYLLLLLWPVNLSPDYSYNQIKIVTSALETSFIVAGLALGGLALVTLHSLKRAKPLAFVLCLFLLSLLPTSNLFFLIGTIMAERFLYLPSIAFCMCVAFVIESLSQACFKQRALLPIAALTMVLTSLYTYRTMERNKDWINNLTLWQSAAQVAPESAKVLSNYADALFWYGDDVDRAIRIAEQGIKIEPDYKMLLSNLGAFYNIKATDYLSRYEKERSEEERELARTYLEGGRKYLERARRLDEERPHRQLNPHTGDKLFFVGSAQIYTGLGSLYFLYDTLYDLSEEVPPEDYLSKAQEALKRALLIDPFHARSHRSLGLIYTRQYQRSQTEQLKEHALTSYLRAILLNKRFPAPHQDILRYLPEETQPGGRFLLQSDGLLALNREVPKARELERRAYTTLLTLCLRNGNETPAQDFIKHTAATTSLRAEDFAYLFERDYSRDELFAWE